MSAALYGRDSAGVTRQIKKLYANAGGVNREIKELWARDGSGVNRKIFSAGLSARSRLQTYHISSSYWSGTTFNAHLTQATTNSTIALFSLVFDNSLSFSEGQDFMWVGGTSSVEANTRMGLYTGTEAAANSLICSSFSGDTTRMDDLDTCYFSGSSNVFWIEVVYWNSSPSITLSGFEFKVNGDWVPLESVTTY